MSVTTGTPVPQMQLHTIFTELHVQVRPASREGVASSGRLSGKLRQEGAWPTGAWPTGAKGRRRSPRLAPARPPSAVRL